MYLDVVFYHLEMNVNWISMN